MNIATAVIVLKRQIVAAREGIQPPSIVVPENPNEYTRGYWGDYDYCSRRLSGRSWQHEDHSFWMSVKACLCLTNEAAFDYWLPLVIAHAFNEDTYDPDLVGAIDACFWEPQKRTSDSELSQQITTEFPTSEPHLSTPRPVDRARFNYLSDDSKHFLECYLDIVAAIATRDGLDDVCAETHLLARELFGR